MSDKTYAMDVFFNVPLLRAAICLVIATMASVHADDTFGYSAGEKELFSDTFADATKSWILGNDAEIKDGKWGPKAPSVPGGAASVSSSLTLPAPISLANGPVAVYFSLQMHAPTGGDGSATSIRLDADNGKNISMAVVPREDRTQFPFIGRDSTGKTISSTVDMQDELTTFKSSSAFLNFRFVISQVAGAVTITPSVWDGTSWYAFGTVTNGVDGEKFDLGSGVFSKITLTTRNNSPMGVVPDPRAFFDGVAITQSPLMKGP